MQERAAQSMPEDAQQDAPTGELAQADRTRLLNLARGTIERALEQDAAPRDLSLDGLPAPLTRTRASFVTLTQGGGLRGCVGSFPARRALADDVCRNAERAAFADARFPPLQPQDLADLQISISALNAPEPVPGRGEAEVRRQLRPGIDGVVLQTPGTGGLFLPQVWAHLPEPADFLRQLKLKAGLSPDAWPRGLRVLRFTADTVCEAAG